MVWVWVNTLRTESKKKLGKKKKPYDNCSVSSDFEQWVKLNNMHETNTDAHTQKPTKHQSLHQYFMDSFPLFPSRVYINLLNIYVCFIFFFFPGWVWFYLLVRWLCRVVRVLFACMYVADQRIYLETPCKESK